MDKPNRKRITTSISYELWRLAQFKELTWSSALEVGIQILAGKTDNEDEIKDRIAKLEGEKEYLLSKIKKIKDDKTQAKLADDKRVVMRWSV